MRIDSARFAIHIAAALGFAAHLLHRSGATEDRDRSHPGIDDPVANIDRSRIDAIDAGWAFIPALGNRILAHASHGGGSSRYRFAHGSRSSRRIRSM
ncbi:hypothetical protein [Lysobacter sp. ESA13C]|uniref:hypothetical protein n=1 Tax=Lysobacter sp. ESA13C TaxID=2862676 RepID=UPI001CBBF688|nr:hypothetical protein [Lysobacter sp. ESA13C]